MPFQLKIRKAERRRLMSTGHHGKERVLLDCDKVTAKGEENFFHIGGGGVVLNIF
jgi:hypothetical protein